MSEFPEFSVNSGNWYNSDLEFDATFEAMGLV